MLQIITCKVKTSNATRRRRFNLKITEKEAGIIARFFNFMGLGFQKAAKSRTNVTDYHMEQCRYCKSMSCVKTGFQKNGKQKLKCKICQKYQVLGYSYKGYEVDDSQIKELIKESVGIRSMHRLLKISPVTVIKRIRTIARKLSLPRLYAPGQIYEMDELHTFIGNKTRQRWIIYAIERSTKKVIDFRIGLRSKIRLWPVIASLLLRKPKRIYTDGYILYKYLVPPKKHRVSQYGTNRIERMNLSLRTQLKRLTRRTICFSRKQDMLETCLKICFWG